MFRIDREKSNKLIYSLKIITFAGILALTNPINSNANSEETNLETEHKDTSKIKYVIYALPFIYVFINSINAYNESVREDEKMFNKKIKTKKDSE